MALSAVGQQIAYPLASGAARDALTASIVVTLGTACLLHAMATRGPRVAARVLLATAVPGFAAELLGLHTGVPFGGYDYSATLGLRVLGVPVVVALAWTMLAWPSAVAARRLVRGRLPRIVVGAWALAAADLFLDPQLVAGGYWRWHDPAPHLPGVPEVPLTNLAGWVAVSLVLSALLQRILDAAAPDPGRETLAVLLYLWLYAGWIVALAGFSDLAGAAAWGAIGMGAVALPLGYSLRR